MKEVDTKGLRERNIPLLVIILWYILYIRDTTYWMEFNYHYNNFIVSRHFIWFVASLRQHVSLPARVFFFCFKFNNDFLVQGKRRTKSYFELSYSYKAEIILFTYECQFFLSFVTFFTNRVVDNKYLRLFSFVSVTSKRIIISNPDFIFRIFYLFFTK